jgi:hypothetical protein
VATHPQREHVVHFLDYCHAHVASLLYPPGDERTARDTVSWNLTEQHLEHVIASGGKWQGDCSEFGSYTLKIAGLWHWSTPGWTGSHLALLPDHYTDGKKARPGALVVFLDRYGNSKHEAVVHTADPKGGDPLVDSHGRNGLDRLHVSGFASEFPSHVYLSIAHL